MKEIVPAIDRKAECVGACVTEQRVTSDLPDNTLSYYIYWVYFEPCSTHTNTRTRPSQVTYMQVFK